jgi:predicted signal transduction protein with EAL and GGDEF domain
MARQGKVFDGIGEASIAWVSLLPELPELTKSLPSSFNVQLCSPSFTGLFDASSHSFNMIVLDLSLNFNQCIDVAQGVRRGSGHVSMAILALIDSAQLDLAEDFFSAGIDELLSVQNDVLFSQMVIKLLERRRSLSILKHTQRLNKQAQRLVKMAHWQFNLGTKKVTFFNPGVFGFDNEEVHTFSEEEFFQRFDSSFDEAGWASLRRQLKAATLGENLVAEYPWRMPDSSLRLVEAHVSQGIDDDTGRPVINGVCIDITERKDARREIVRLAYFDPVTDAPNRAMMERYLRVLITDAYHRGQRVGFFNIDLDHFSRVNHVLGHLAGDEVLRQVADRLRSKLAPHNRVSKDLLDSLLLDPSALFEFGNSGFARLAADNFGLGVVLDLDDNGESYCDVIMSCFQQPFKFYDQELSITASVGSSYSESAATSVNSLIQQADLALHQAKAQGRNRSSLFSSDVMPSLSRQISFQSELRHALANDEFCLYYQPKFDVASSKLIGFEALLRWRHPRLSLVMPDQFIPLAEETGLIVDIGYKVIREACKQILKFNQAGFNELCFAVNVSGRQLRRQDFVDKVANIIAETGVAPGQLELEVTEGILLAEPEVTARVIEIREMGVLIALDDFGTGYASMSYLVQFPFDTLKIDRSFVSEVSSHPKKAAIVRALTGLAHDLGVIVVAEGVETQTELAVIAELGCDQVQGYLLGRPIPSEQLEGWLSDYHKTRKYNAPNIEKSSH